MDLLSIGVELEEKDKSLLLLCSLLKSFDLLITMLLYGKEIIEGKEICFSWITNVASKIFL